MQNTFWIFPAGFSAGAKTGVHEKGAHPGNPDHWPFLDVWCSGPLLRKRPWETSCALLQYYFCCLFPLRSWDCLQTFLPAVEQPDKRISPMCVGTFSVPCHIPPFLVHNLCFRGRVVECVWFETPFQRRVYLEVPLGQLYGELWACELHFP